MRTSSSLRIALMPAVLAVALAAAPLPAAAEPADDNWHFSVMPYLWVPTISGTLQFHGRGAAGDPTVDIKATPGDYLPDLEMALLLAAEGRKGKWLLFSDVNYFKLGIDNSSVRTVDFNVGPGPVNPTSTTLDAGTQTDSYLTIWTIAGGYNLVQEPKVTLDLIGGARYVHAKMTTDWRLTANVVGPGGGTVFPAAGSVTETEDIWDGIVGVKGRLKLGEGSWFIPYYLDVGTGSSDLTWQAQTGIGYAFRWGDLLLGYRYLAYERDDKLVKDMKLYGFGLGGIFYF